MSNLHLPGAKPGMLPAEQRESSEAAVQYVEALQRAFPQLAGAFHAGVTITVKLDAGPALQTRLQAGGIVPATNMPGPRRG